MKAIILAAGEGTRLKPITDEIPKALVEIQGKSLLEYNLDCVYRFVDEICIVVKYKKEKVVEKIGHTYKWIPVSYHEQWEIKWTAGALLWIYYEDDVIIVYSDAIVDQRDVAKVFLHEWFATLATKVQNPEKYGILKTDDDGYLMQVVEKPKTFIGDLACFSFFKVSKYIFKCIEKITLSPRWELELTDAINMYCKTYLIKVLSLDYPLYDITNPQDRESTQNIFTLWNISPDFSMPQIGETKYIQNIWWAYQLYVWISTNNIEKLIEYSLDTTDESLHKNTGDKKRFSTKSDFEKWYSDVNRILFTLTDEKWTLCGISWFRPAELPHIQEITNKEIFNTISNSKANIHTNGIRIYPIARGKWLARDFLTVSQNEYYKKFPNAIISIDIEINNVASQKAFEKVGYTFIGYGENKKSFWGGVTNKRKVYMYKK